jgi:Family of unknown function (DUF5989)
MSDQAFEELASKHRSHFFLLEIWRFLRQTKKWWLVPVLVTLLLLGMLMWMSSTAAAPFIYTLF